MAEEGYRGPQVCSIVGITYRQLDYWARTDLLKPTLAEARGSGTQRRYSYTDLLELKVIKRLLDAGVSLQSARRAIKTLHDNVGADLASANLVLAESHSVLAKTDGEVVDLLKGGQGVLNMVLPLGGVKDELDAAIHELGAEVPAPAATGTRSGAAAGSGG
jgi:DNA-binding transcriptional MerR regulator